jgi:hypothetical protein
VTTFDLEGGVVVVVAVATVVFNAQIVWNHGEKEKSIPITSDF